MSTGDCAWKMELSQTLVDFPFNCQGLAKSESTMGAILTLSLNFQQMSNLCERIIQYQATLWIEIMAK